MKNEKTVPYNLRLPEKLKTKLEKQAKEERRSLNKHLVHLLESMQAEQARKPEVVNA